MNTLDENWDGRMSKMGKERKTVIRWTGNEKKDTERTEDEEQENKGDAENERRRGREGGSGWETHRGCGWPRCLRKGSFPVVQALFQMKPSRELGFCLSGFPFRGCPVEGLGWTPALGKKEELPQPRASQAPLHPCPFWDTPSRWLWFKPSPSAGPTLLYCYTLF